MRKLVIRLHFTCPLKMKLLGKPCAEARRHAVRLLADRYVRLTDCFSRAAAGAGKEKRADGQWGLEPHSATDSASWGFGPARVNTFTGKDDGGTSDALTFLTYNIEGLSTVYQPCVRSYISGFDFILLTETFSTCFPVHLFPLHDVFVSPGVRLTDSKTARLSGGVALLVRKKTQLLC